MFEKIKEHAGHNIVAVRYGDWDDPMNVAIECEDCGCVIVDEDNPGVTDEATEKNWRERYGTEG